MSAADKIASARALIEPLRATVLWGNANPDVMKAAETLDALADLADAQAQQLVLICDGCGTTRTDAEMKVWVAERPDVRRSCCPERKMRPITRAEWDAQAQENKRLREALNRIADFGPSRRHNQNRNDLIACAAADIAASALGDAP